MSLSFFFSLSRSLFVGFFFFFSHCVHAERKIRRGVGLQDGAHVHDCDHKGQSKKGMGDELTEHSNRTVTLCLVVAPPFRMGKCCPFFFLCLVRCPLPFSVFLFLGSLSGINFRERTIVWGGRCWSYVFRWHFSVIVVFVCFFSRDTDQVPGHPHTARFWSVFFFVPPRAVCRPFWPCALSLCVSLGVPFWAPRVFWILLELTGLELARPFWGHFWTRGDKCVSVFPFCGFCFPFCGVCGFTRFASRPANGLTYGRPGALDVPPFAAVAKGAPRARRVGPLLSRSVICFNCLVWVTGTLRASLFGGGAIFGLPPGLSRARFVPCPGFFFCVCFFFLSALGACVRIGVLDAIARNQRLSRTPPFCH